MPKITVALYETTRIFFFSRHQQKHIAIEKSEPRTPSQQSPKKGKGGYNHNNFVIPQAKIHTHTHTHTPSRNSPALAFLSPCRNRRPIDRAICDLIHISSLFTFVIVLPPTTHRHTRTTLPHIAPHRPHADTQAHTSVCLSVCLSVSLPAQPTTNQPPAPAHIRHNALSHTHIPLSFTFHTRPPSPPTKRNPKLPPPHRKHAFSQGP